MPPPKKNRPAKQTQQELLSELEQLRSQVAAYEAEAEALRESEMRYRTLVELSPDVIGVHSEGKVVFINPAGAELVGAEDPKQFAQTPLADFIHPDSLALFHERITHLEQTHCVPLTELKILRLDGTSLFVEATAAAVIYEGRPAVQFIARNITERKRAEQARQDSEDRYRQLVEQASDILYRADALGCFTYANPVALRITGYSEEEIIGKNYLELVRPDHRERLRAFYVRQRDEQIENTYCEFPAITKDGREVWFGQNVQLVREQGAIVGVQAVARDITERKRAEEALTASEQRYRLYMDAAYDAIFIADEEGMLIDANLKAQELIGRSLEEIRQMHQAELHPEEERERYTRLFQDSFAHDRVFRANLDVVHRDGRRIPVDVSATILEVDGKPLIQGIFRDISERKQAEEALRQSERRFRNLIEQASDGIFIITFRGRYLDANSRACEMIGYSRAELLEMRPEELIAEESLRERPIVWDALQPGQTVRLERYYRRRDGSVFPVEVSLKRIDEDVVQAIVRDITERKQTEESLRRYAGRLEVLLAIDQAILNAQSSRAIAEVALCHLRKLIPCERASITLFDADADEALILAEDQDPGIPLDLDRRLSLRTFGPSETIRMGGVDRADDLRTLPEPEPMQQELLEAGLHAALEVALVVQHELIGTLYLAASRAGAFTDEHVDIAREVASQLSLALHSARLYEEVEAARGRLEQISRRLVETQEKERRHLALELHDEIGQILTALKLSLDTAQDAALPEPAAGPPGAASGAASGEGSEAALPFTIQAKLERAKQLTDLLTAKVRGLSLDLRPTLLDDLGLLPALLWYFKRYTEQTGIQVRFRHTGLSGQRFTNEVETAAYRIVQEALTNVARHAEVPEVDVEARQQGGVLLLQVKDEGAGFDMDQVEGAIKTSGLSGMRERAALVGGRITIRTDPEEGVHLTATLPLRADGAARGRTAFS